MMNECELNRGDLKAFSASEGYEEKFRLPLTARHMLVIARWEEEEAWGVDLRRWSYGEARLLLSGITLTSDSWKWLCDHLIKLNRKQAFVQHGGIDRRVYVASRKLSSGCELTTSVFDEARKPYFCINLNKGGKPVWRATGTITGILIRFDTVADFLAKAGEHRLTKLPPHHKGKPDIDPGSGRTVL